MPKKACTAWPRKRICSFSTGRKTAPRNAPWFLAAA
nr:MAG TPA: hypothetical protein [Caudoviricetes sp.]